MFTGISPPSAVLSYRKILILMVALTACHAGPGYTTLAEYVIELHNAGAEERVGLAEICADSDRPVRNPLDDQDLLRGQSFEILSKFDLLSPIQEEIAGQGLSDDFFGINLIDHIWKFYTPGQGLKRELGLRERYVIEQSAIQYQTTVRRFGLFRKRRMQQGELIRYRIWIHFTCYHQSGRSIDRQTFQHWIINVPGRTSESSFFQSQYEKRVSYRRAPGTLGSPINPEPVHQSDRPLPVLWPFAHFWYGDAPVEQGASSNTQRHAYIFPMDWQWVQRNTYRPIAMTVTIAPDQLRIYERHRGRLKKKETPDTFHRYDFLPSVDSTMQFTIWGDPAGFIPWAWEYRDNALGSRAILYIRIIPKEDQEPPVAEVAASLQAKKEPAGTQGGGDGWGGGPRVPMLELAEDVPESDKPGPVPETRFKLLDLLFSPAKYHCHKGYCRDTYSNFPLPVKWQ